ncbi:MAG: glycerol-3-phosphate 1-O-acyltransferase PlsY [Lentisphaeria bacterium]|jgi:glycerol-3-phosphate acyltransferase PlsY
MPPAHCFWLLALAGAYLAGAVPFGYLIGKFNGIDIRRHGSGNIGATNVLRVIGKPWGYTCFLLDFLKGALPVLAAWWLAPRLAGPTPLGQLNQLAPVFAAAGTLAGHLWPVWLKFKGGKGVATTLGALGVLAPLPILAGLLCWLVVFKLSRYVSLASILAAAAMPATALAMHLLGRHPSLLRGEAPQLPVLLTIALAAALVIIRHRANIVRLRNGSESRFAKK